MTDALIKEQGWKIFYPKTRETRPHVSVMYDDSALSSKSGADEKNIFLIGSSTQGNPNAIYELNTLAEARANLGTGDLVDACELIWDTQSSTFNNGSTVYALRVESATQATLTEGNLTFTSKAYGKIANSVTLTFDKDPLTQAYRLEVINNVDGYDHVYANLGNLFTVQYTGTQASALLDITHDSNGNANQATIKVGDSGSESTILTLDLTSQAYESVYEVMDAISKLPDFTVVSTSSNTSMDSKYLDTVSAQDVKTTAYTVKAVAGDIIYQTRNDSYIEVSVDLKKQLPSAFTQVALTGGTDGSVPVSWADKFAQVRNINAYYIVPLTAQQNIQAELKAFLDEQDILGYQYRGFVGGGFNDSLVDTISRQQMLKDDRIALVGNSGYYSTLDGRNLHIPGYMMAAYVAGVCSSLGVGEACTFKTLNLTNLDQVFSGSDLDRLDSNGVIAIEYHVNRNATSCYRIVEDVTTFNNQNEPVKSLVSLGELTDFLLAGVKNYLEENYIGMSVRALSSDLIKTGVDSYLSQQVNNGLLYGYDSNDIVVSISGNVGYITFSATPARSLRNILVRCTYENINESTSSNSSTNYGSTVVGGNAN